MGIVKAAVYSELKMNKYVESYKTDNFKLVFKDVPSCSWCLDGDEYKHDSKEFVFGVTNEISMQIPKKNINKLFN